MSLLLDVKFEGFPFLDPRRNSPSSFPVSPSEAEEDVEMAQEPASDSESLPPASDPASDIVEMPQVDQSAAQPAVAIAARTALHNQPMVSLSGTSIPNYRYTEAFMKVFEGRFYYITQSRKNISVTLKTISYDKQQAVVTPNKGKRDMLVSLQKLKCNAWTNQLFLIRQQDGKYALGKDISMRNSEKTIQWVGSDKTASFPIEGDHDLARFIPVTEGDLKKCFIETKKAYCVDSDQFISSYILL